MRKAAEKAAFFFVGDLYGRYDRNCDIIAKEMEDVRRRGG